MVLVDIVIYMKNLNKIVVVVVAEPFSYDVQVCTETFHFQENVMKNEDNTFSQKFEFCKAICENCNSIGQHSWKLFDMVLG